LRKLQQVIFYIEAVEKAAKENKYGTWCIIFEKA
jgi:hypothetical protein